MHHQENYISEAPSCFFHFIFIRSQAPFIHYLFFPLFVQANKQQQYENENEEDKNNNNRKKFDENENMIFCEFVVRMFHKAAKR